MRQYIATFGFDTRRITRAVIREGVDSGDQIVLLQPTVNFEEEGDEYAAERATEGTRELIEFFNQIDESIRIVSVPVTCSPLRMALQEVSALVTEPARPAEAGIPQNAAAKDAPPLGTKAVETILCPGGGPRELLFAVTIAAAAHLSHISEVVMHGDLDNGVANVNLPQVNPHISDRVEDTFQALINEISPTRTQTTETDDDSQSELTVTELRELTGKSKSTIGRHLDTLESEGVVFSTRRGKERVACLTLSAELYVRDQGQRRVP